MKGGIEQIRGKRGCHATEKYLPGEFIFPE